MQAVTHLAVGAALGALAFRLIPEGASRLWRVATVLAAAALAAASHSILDDLALATYHPPDARWRDPFWVGYHVLVVGAAIALAWRARRFAPTLAASLAPDVDWFIGRPLGLWEPGAVHAAFRRLPGLAQLSAALRDAVPDRRESAWGALPEAALAVLVLAAVLAAASGRRRGDAPAA